MANTSYATPITITVTNVIDPATYVATDAGCPSQRVNMLYADAAKVPFLKWDYLFNVDGTFTTGSKDESTGEITLDDTTDTSHDYVVVAYRKFKTTDRIVPAYRTANAKTLKAGDSFTFTTSNKDEAVFYEKLGAAFAGELTVEVEPQA